MRPIAPPAVVITQPAAAALNLLRPDLSNYIQIAYVISLLTSAFAPQVCRKIRINVSFDGQCGDFVARRGSSEDDA